MDILITAPTYLEMKYLVDFFHKNHASVLSPHSMLKKFKNEKITFSLLITGVGINQTAYQLATCFAKSRFDYAIQIGICGSLDERTLIGSVYQIVSEEFADFGAEDKYSFLKASDIHLVDKNEFPFEENKLNNKSEPLQNLDSKAGLTFNTVLGNKYHIGKIKKYFTGAICTMESASFFYACLHNQIPFHAIRSVSNLVEERNKNNWNIDLALVNLNKEILKIIQNWK